MSRRWSEIPLARVARAKAEEQVSVDRGKAEPRQAEGPKTASRPVRRVLHLRLSSLAL